MDTLEILCVESLNKDILQYEQNSQNIHSDSKILGLTAKDVDQCVADHTEQDTV